MIPEKDLFGIAVVGCGTVGNATATLLLSEAELFFHRTNIPVSLKAMVGRSFDKAKKFGLDESLFKRDLQAVLDDPEIKLVAELVGGVTDARDIVERALKAGKHVVTANKALLAHHGAELLALARKNGVAVGFEASCAGGVPIVRALVDGLLANRNEALYGIVNGTCNFILSSMAENGMSYDDALELAQKNGLAEADPSLDVSGMDAAHKLTLLGSLAFGETIPLDSIPVEGIDRVDLFDVATGRELGYVLKLLALARKTGKGLELAVAPVFLHDHHPLARVSGPFNAVSVYGHAVGHTMYYGRGAGGSPTSSAVVSDILSIALGTWPLVFNALNLWPDRSSGAKIAVDGLHRYYLRFMIEDRPGIVAYITAALAERQISLVALVQKETHEGVLVPLVLTTHKALDSDVSKVFEVIRALPAVHDPAVKLRIVDEHAESL